MGVFLYFIANYIRKKGKDRKRVILIGTGTRAKKFIEVVNKNFSWGLDIIGLLTGDEEKIGEIIMGVKVIDKYNNIEHILKEINPEEIIVTISTKRFDKLRDVFEICEKEGVRIRLNSDFFGKLVKNIKVDKVFGLNILTIDMINNSEFELFLKRLIDIIGSLFALIISLPFMIIAAIGILISDGYPILYNWNVIGKDKKEFHSWKFRTMIKDAEKNGAVWAESNDSRITPFGKFLRKTRIDEIPQFYNILKGQMALIGPRPERPEFVRQLSNKIPLYEIRHVIKPGLTGWAQVMYPYAASVEEQNKKLRFDLFYIKNHIRSLLHLIYNIYLYTIYT